MNKEAQCFLCPTHHCVESNTNLGKVKVRIENTKVSDSNRGSIVDINKVLIKDCPVKKVLEEKELDDIEDRRNY